MSARDAALHIAEAWRIELREPAAPRTVAVLWAQWALETGRGRSMVANNFGGLKGRAPTGAGVVCWTREGHAGAEVRIRSRFRAYASPLEGARDWIRTIARSYPGAIEAARSGDTADYVRALSARRYFTADPDDYQKAVTSLAREFVARGPNGGGAARWVDPGPAVQGVLWALERAIARRRD